jgi:competence protein ComEC
VKKHPAILFAVFFISGLFLQKQLQPQPAALAAALAGFILFLLFILKNRSFFILKEITACVLIILSGAAYISSYNAGREGYPFEKIKQKELTAYGKITGLELFREYEIRFRLKPDSLTGKDVRGIIDNSFLCRIRDKNRNSLDSLYNRLSDGNTICIKGAASKGMEKRNPYEFDYQKYIENSGLSGLFTAYSVNDVKILNSSKDFLSSFILDIRKFLDYKISALHTPQTAALLKGLLIGDRSEISEEVNNQFINSGVMHVIAISGQHVAYILVIFVLLFGRFNIYIRSALTAVGLFFFLFITGMSPSVFRAVVMALVIITGYLTNRSVNGFNAVSVSALILLLIDPNTLFDPGFQLSFTAVLGMMTFGRAFVQMINRLKLKSKIVQAVLMLTFVSFTAQIGTLPLTLYYFGKLSVAGILANILIVPVSGVIISIGIVTLFCSAFWMWGASVYALENEFLVKFTLLTVKTAGEWKHAYLSINGFSLYDVIVSFAFIITAVFFFRKTERSLVKIVVAALAVGNVLVYTAIDNREILPQNKMTVIMIDVGQGDSFLIRFPNGQTALIDAGEAAKYFDNGERVILPLINKLGIGKIDYAFISHLDSDHCGGFISLIRKGKINRVFKPAISDSSIKDSLFEKYCSQFNTPVNHYSEKNMSVGNVRIYFLTPPDSIVAADKNDNDKSGIIKIVYGKTAFLFTGDIEKGGERKLIERYGNFLKCNVLKIPHHGSKTSSSFQFLKITSPEIALISAGRENKFGHPAHETIEKLTGLKARILRTDLNGAVILSGNGDKIEEMEE